jgi:hypothetical protein
VLRAQALFAEIDAENLIGPGLAESEINENTYVLAARMMGFRATGTSASCGRAATLWHPIMRILQI